MAPPLFRPLVSAASALPAQKALQPLLAGDRRGQLVPVGSGAPATERRDLARRVMRGQVVDQEPLFAAAVILEQDHAGECAEHAMCVASRVRHLVALPDHSLPNHRCKPATVDQRPGLVAVGDRVECRRLQLEPAPAQVGRQRIPLREYGEHPVPVEVAQPHRCGFRSPGRTSWSRRSPAPPAVTSISPSSPAGAGGGVSTAAAWGASASTMAYS